MSVSIEPEPPAKPGLGREELVRSGLDVLEQPGVNLIQLSQHLTERQLLLLRRGEGIERIDAAVCGGVPRRAAALKDDWQVEQCLLFPRGDMRQDVSH